VTVVGITEGDGLGIKEGIVLGAVVVGSAVGLGVGIAEGEDVGVIVG
jgi:hypothetical protein